MKQFTIAQARELIKRELGIDAASLTAPTRMNGNSDYPWYEMFSGNQRISLYVSEHHDAKLVVLSVSFEHAITNTMQYFYADTLEFADKATELQKWKDIEDLTYFVDMKLHLRKLEKETQEADQAHIAYVEKLNAQSQQILQEKTECICSQEFETTAIQQDAEAATHRKMNSETACTATVSEQESLDSDTKEWIIELWDEGEAKADDTDYDLNDAYRAYLATVERWSAQGQPYLGHYQEGYGYIVDAIDTMLYYEAHPEEAAQERVLAGTQQSEPARALDEDWDL